jgi:hypothetical protein
MLAASGVARARDSSVRLEYHAPAGCPSDSELAAEVEKRLERAKLAGTAELARTYRITIEVEPGRSVAHLELTDADGQRATRELTAPTCQEAARAIALVTALAIEARVAEEAAAERRAPSVAPPPAELPRAATPMPAPAPRPRTEEPARHVLVAGAGVEDGFAPRAAPRVTALFEFPVAGLATRAGVVWASTGPVEIDGGSATFSLQVLRAQLCPWRWAPSSAFELGPCAGVDLGLLHAAGRRSARIVHPDSTTRPWLAGSLALAAAVAPDPRLGFELEAGLGLPATRPVFTLENPDVDVYHVPVSTWYAVLGLAGRF